MFAKQAEFSKQCEKVQIPAPCSKASLKDSGLLFTDSSLRFELHIKLNRFRANYLELLEETQNQQRKREFKKQQKIDAKKSKKSESKGFIDYLGNLFNYNSKGKGGKK